MNGQPSNASIDRAIAYLDPETRICERCGELAAEACRVEGRQSLETHEAHRLAARVARRREAREERLARQWARCWLGRMAVATACLILWIACGFLSLGVWAAVRAACGLLLRRVAGA